MASLAELLGRTAAPALDPNAASFDAMGAPTVPAVGQPQPRSNTIMEPSLQDQLTGSWITPEMDVRHWDSGPEAYWRDTGEPVQFSRRPGILKIADLLGNIVGGAAPAGAIRSGFSLPARASQAAHYDPTIAEGIGSFIGAAKQNARGGMRVAPETAFEAGTNLPAIDELFSGVTQPSAGALRTADRALAQGYDTPLLHLSGGKPWRNTELHRTETGAVYGADNLESIVKSGAAVGAGGGNDGFLHTLLARAPIFGEHMPPAEMLRNMPTAANGGKSSMADLVNSIQTSPWRGEALDNYARALGQRGMSSAEIEERIRQVAQSDQSLAKSLQQVYYDPAMGGERVPGHIFGPVQGGRSQPGIPGYQAYEAGALQRVSNGTGGFLPGAPSPMQVSMQGAGFTGSRVVDGVANYNGAKTIAMHLASALRSPFAKFDPAKAHLPDTMAARVPAGAFYSQPQSEAQQ